MTSKTLTSLFKTAVVVFALSTASGACLASDDKSMPGSICVGTNSVQAAALSYGMAGVKNNAPNSVQVVCPVGIDSDTISNYSTDAITVVIEGTRVGSQNQAVICGLGAMREEGGAQKTFIKTKNSYGTGGWNIYFTVDEFVPEINVDTEDSNLISQLTAICTLPTGAILNRIKLYEWSDTGG